MRCLKSFLFYFNFDLMKQLRRILTISITVLTVGYLCLNALLFIGQEAIVFHPTKLAVDYKFQFSQPFEEVYITAKDSTHLHGVLLKADSSKGLVFYLHGNGGTVDSWGRVAPTYTTLGYDVFVLDYRGYGKSGGVISSEQQFFDDVQSAYNQMKIRYNENEIIVLGHSIGTGVAAWLASTNQPKSLILEAPYYSLVDLTKHLLPVVPTDILKYKFETFKYLQQTKVPVVIFHGRNDEVIYCESSVKLKPYLKSQDRLIFLDRQGHCELHHNSIYIRHIEEILQ